jgi:hypothetical protein
VRFGTMLALPAAPRVADTNGPAPMLGSCRCIRPPPPSSRLHDPAPTRSNQRRGACGDGGVVAGASPSLHVGEQRGALVELKERGAPTWEKPAREEVAPAAPCLGSSAGAGGEAGEGRGGGGLELTGATKIPHRAAAQGSRRMREGLHYALPPSSWAVRPPSRGPPPSAPAPSCHRS